MKKFSSGDTVIFPSSSNMDAGVSPLILSEKKVVSREDAANHRGVIGPVEGAVVVSLVGAQPGHPFSKKWICSTV